MDTVAHLLLEHRRSDARWIGLEVERLVVHSGLETATYEGQMQPLLRYLKDTHAWRVDDEVEGNLLGLTRNLHAISLEPGAQLEVSLAPQKNLQDVERVSKEIDREIFDSPILKDWSVLEIGLNPWQRPEELKLLPSPRYQLMDAHFQLQGGRGREMMRLSTGLQVNLDFSSEAEGVEMFTASMKLAPFLATLFANSPFQLGKASGNLSERHFVWNQTDPTRSGFLKFVFEKGWSLQTYADYVNSVPMMYAYSESGEVLDPQGQALRDLPAPLQRRNALASLRQLFTEVRFKPCCVEIRYFDQVDLSLRLAATGLCLGLIYDDENRRRVLKTFEALTRDEASHLMDEGARMGLKSATIYQTVKNLVSWAEEGLTRRGFGEEKFLAPLDDHLLTRKTPADLLLEKHSQSWRS